MPCSRDGHWSRAPQTCLKKKPTRRSTGEHLKSAPINRRCLSYHYSISWSSAYHQGSTWSLETFGCWLCNSSGWSFAPLARTLLRGYSTVSNDSFNRTLPRVLFWRKGCSSVLRHFCILIVLLVYDMISYDTYCCRFCCSRGVLR